MSAAAPERPPQPPPLVVLVVPFLASIAAGVIVGLVLQALAGRTPQNRILFSPASAAAILAAYAASLAATLWATRQGRVPAVALLGLARPKLARTAALALVAFLAASAAASALEPILHGARAQGLTTPAPLPHDLSGRVGLALMLVALVVAAPVCEELYYRGLIYGSLEPRTGALGAVLLSAAAFGAAHLILAALLVLVLLGVLLALLRARTGTIWAGLGTHMLFNLTAVLIDLHVL